jgi:hypothetical protein
MKKYISVNETEVADDFEKKLKHSAAGRKANSRGKLSGALLGNAAGAVRAAGYDNNLFTLDGEPVRFHSIGGGKMNFTVNPETEPACLIAAFSVGEPQQDKPLRCLLYGLKREDCIRSGRPTSSKSAPNRLSVSLSQVRRVRLGDAYLPAEYTEAETVADRMDLMDVVDQLTPDELGTVMGAATRQKIREFVLAGREQSAPVTAPVVALPAEESARAAAE